MQLDAIIIDFETRSMCDLPVRGGDNYATDPTTDILCMAALDLTNGDKWLWYPHDGALPESLVHAIEDAEFIAAHNASFDRGIWECVGVSDYGFPALPLEKWYCTAAQCRVNAVPASLDGAGMFITGRRQKMAAGRALIKELSIPNDMGKFNNNPAALKRMGEYCLQDTAATALVVKATRIMTAQEHSEYIISERINDRGVLIDIELAGMCAAQAKHEATELSDLIRTLTDGMVTSITQHQRVKKWFLSVLPDDVIAKYLTRKVDGETKISFDKAVRTRMLNDTKMDALKLSFTTEAILTMVNDGSKSSVAKFNKMLSLASPVDHRVRGAYVYAGASQTKRFSAKGLQVHNFRRDCIAPDEVDSAMHFLASDMAALIGDESVMETLSMLLRPALIPDAGCIFTVCDWSAIEGRVLPWLADSRGGEEVLDVFRADEDIYMHTAKGMGIKDRQIGKVATLALGFQGGVNAFNAMGRNYGLTLADEDAQLIVTGWRETNAWAPTFWRKLDRAAMGAMNFPNTWRRAGRVAYIFIPTMLEGTLICKLPDESVIQYPKARVDMVEVPWGGEKPAITYAKAGLSMAAGAKEWPRSTLYSGLACENATQAVAASLLREALKCCYDEKLAVVLHVHDEIVLESPKGTAQEDAMKLQKIMETAPKWAKGLPLKAVPEFKARYGK